MIISQIPNQSPNRLSNLPTPKYNKANPALETNNKVPIRAKKLNPRAESVSPTRNNKIAGQILPPLEDGKYGYQAIQNSLIADLNQSQSKIREIVPEVFDEPYFK